MIACLSATPMICSNSLICGKVSAIGSARNMLKDTLDMH